MRAQSGQPFANVHDPTAKHIPHTHIPYSIQGKDALIYKGDTYGMLNVPMLEPQKSVDRLEV